MHYLNIATLVTVIAFCSTFTQAQPIKPNPDPEALQIIAELDLTESPTPVSDNPSWNPRRIVVSVPAMMSTILPGYEQHLRMLAGTAELVVDTSANLQPDDAMLVGADAVIGICTMPLIRDASKSLLWVHNYTVGMDRCADLSPDQIEGRVFTNNKRLSGPTIAEHTIAMMMSLARGLPAYQRAQSAGKWDRALAEQVSFGEIEGKTMLVVGLGGIGTQIAWRAHGLGMRVIAVRNSSSDGPDYVEHVGMQDELLELAAQANVIVNALPLTDETRGLFNEAFFASTKPGAMFISVGRGESTVTADLVKALQSGQLYGAGLDVMDPEPLPADSPLWQLDNVIITPHVSGAGMDNIRRTAIIAAENLRRYMAGEPLLNIVNMQAGY